MAKETKYVIEIERTSMDKVRDAFYRKDGMEKLIAYATDGASPAALDVIMDKYAQAYATWQTEMSTIEKAVLGTYCQSFKYDYTMDFLNSTMTLVTSEPSAEILIYLENIGKKIY